MKEMDTKDEYELLLKEIKHHKEDAESAKATHYEAAIRNEKLYSSFLFCGFIITLLGVSCLLCSFINYMHFCQNWIGQSVTLIGAGITLWPLIADYSGKAISYRRSAEEYNSICKKCINWKSDFPDKSCLAEAKKDIAIIRNSINFINNLSPRTTYSDFIKGREKRKAGNYLYDSDKKNVSNNQNNNNIMSETGSEINEIMQKQNTPEAIRLLKAQRIAYSYSKRYGYLDLLIAILSILIYCYAVNISGTTFGHICLIITSICSLGMIFSSKLQKKQTLIGAGIQEKFDNEILGLPQNMILTPVYPSIEIIANYSSKYKKNDLSNWYMEYIIDDHPLPIAILRCQLLNLLWDKIQRKAFKTMIIIVLILVFTIISIVCYVNNYFFREFIDRFILISPAIIYLFKILYGQTEMIRNKDELIKHILDLLHRSNDGYMPTKAELRNIQDVIYSQRIKVNSTISDIWYKIKKRKTEKYVKQVFDNL
jgi:hypothetical protein